MPTGVTLSDLGIEPPERGARLPSTAVEPPPSRPGFAFQPGLEGLRGLAVLAVLVFHGGFTWATGGFLGVSTFFTLSGFLITTLLLAERQRSGTIALRRFWARRFRRLMPAALVCLAGVAVFGATVATPQQLVSLRGDMLAALLYVANWRFIADGASYAELFSQPSPVLHFWSLAIEEQFYLLFPLLVAGLLAAGRGSRRLLGGVVAAGAIASVWYMALLASGDVDAAYYNTFSRAAELLVGVLLALALQLPSARRRLASAAAGRTITAAGLVALVVSIALWGVVHQTDGWLYRGGLAGYALLTAVLVVAVIEPGPLRRGFSNPVLRWLGRISYGAYLYHWPIFLWLTPRATGLSEWPLFGLRMAVTLVAATVSFHLIEQPIRTGRLLTGWQPFVVAPLAATLLVVGIVRVTADPPTELVIDFEGGAEFDVPDFVADEAVDAPPPPTTVPKVSVDDYVIPAAPELPDPPLLRAGEAPRVYLGGDSAMFTLGVGLTYWARDTGIAQVWNAGKLGCGLTRGGRLIYVGQEREAWVECDAMPYAWHDDVRRVRPHVVALMGATWDVGDRMIPGDDQWRAPGDPVYDQFLRHEITVAVDTLQSQGATVVLLTHPLIETGITEQLPGPFPEAEPERMHRLNEILVEVSRTRPRTMVLDLAGHMASRPIGELDLTERPDGIHWTDESSRTLADWLGPQLAAIARGEPTDPGVIISAS